MCSSTRRALQVRLQHGRTSIGCNFFQMHLLVPTMMEGDVPPRCSHVLHPARARTEHGHQIAFTGNDSHNERQADAPTGAPARHLEGDQIIGRNPERIDFGRAAIE